MSNDMNSVPNVPEGVDFSEMQLSAVSEIQNISMGSAATAVSNLLDAKVWITTPRVRIIKYKDVNYTQFDPSIRVTVNYIKGVTGTNAMILKQSDVQLMLNQLMGLPLVVTDDFVFDELNISAVSEVMNQMMGSAATALSEFLGMPIDISTPIAKVTDAGEEPVIEKINDEDYVVEVQFKLTIDNVINSEFISILEIDLARSLASNMLKDFAEEQAPAPQTEKQPSPSAQPAPQPAPQPASVHQPAFASQPTQQPSAQPGYYGAPIYDYAQPQAFQQPYPPMYQQPISQQREPLNVKNIQLAQFDSFDSPSLTNEQHDNLRLLMNVPLDISVELGRAKRKVKEILEFTQGTIIELDRQAGAPVDVIVNGHLIARGDVVVIDDNFAVRITEIVKSKFLDTLGNKE